MLSIQEHIILAPYTTFGIGGPADFFVKVSSPEEIIEAVRWANEKGIAYFVLGKGANILVGDKGYRGLIIKNEANKISAKRKAGSVKDNQFDVQRLIRDATKDEVFLTAESGADVQEIIHFTAQKGFSGFEHFAGIPSTIGGALWQNLHFLSPDRSRTVFISEILESAEILTYSSSDPALAGESSSRLDLLPRAITVFSDYFHFAYDYSSLHDSKDIVLSATFRLQHEKRDIINERINANLQWRLEKHPENATRSSAGSVFKKIEGHGAGRLIEQVGLKGHTIGGAQISERHANFIVNTGEASAKDVRDMIELVETKVKQEMGLTMQPEISFVGEF